MLELIAVTVVITLLPGVALGWYLRRINSWCPHCGDKLTCTGCGARPSWSSPGRTSRPTA
jgi:hypothetical protein